LLLSSVEDCCKTAITPFKRAPRRGSWLAPVAARGFIVVFEGLPFERTNAYRFGRGASVGKGAALPGSAPFNFPLASLVWLVFHRWGWAHFRSALHLASLGSDFSPLASGITSGITLPLVHSVGRAADGIASVITCPVCSHISIQTMPTAARQYIYECSRCGPGMKAIKGKCCAYCSRLVDRIHPTTAPT
jgi:hypothetical protein